MGKTTILNGNQQKFLEFVLKEPYLLKRFYWTGGTVLSEFYLHHRESQDIDLFSEDQEIHLPSINKFIGITSAKMGIKKIIHEAPQANARGTCLAGRQVFSAGFGRASPQMRDPTFYPTEN